MSAICGLFRFDGAPVPSGSLRALLDALRGFGAEAASWAPGSPDAPVALGCRPVRVTPEDAFYHPPLRSRDGGVVLVADARIDNRSELAADLGVAAGEAAELPDAAYILAAYQAWGTDFARHLLGDFAVAIWDQGRRSLICARDGIGHRVLFYHVSPRQLALATTPQALLALEDVPARLNEQKVAEFLVLLQDPESTFFTGIQRLLPGHTLTATADGVRTQRFWSPEPTRKIILGSDREYVEGFCQVFEEAVRARLRVAGPVGILLSGGLDSTAVAAVASSQLAGQGRRLTAFHAAPRLGFRGKTRPGSVADESEDVAAVAARYSNLELRIRRTDGRTPLDSLDAMFQISGMPQPNASNRVWAEDSFSAARSTGVRIMLAGHKGNATISYTGLRSLKDSARQGQWRHVWREVRALARATGQRTWDVLEEQVLLPLAPAILAQGYLRLRGGRPEPIWTATYSAIRPEFAKAAGLEERARAVGADPFSALRAGGLGYRIRALTAAGDAPDMANAFRQLFGIETWEPVSDLRVVEYCFAIPDSQYLSNGRSRWLIRRAMAGRLPERVLDRTTRGAQAADWIEWFPALRGQIRDELERLDRCDTARRCLDLPRLRSLVERWPDQLGPEHEPEYHLRLMRGIVTGWFIRWFEQTYS